MCCQGYQRDSHIVRKCNPICQTDCVNGICYSPNECICFPEHVKNLAGYCVPTCPIGEFKKLIMINDELFFFVLNQKPFLIKKKKSASISRL